MICLLSLMCYCSLPFWCKLLFMCLHQDIQENQEREGTQGRGVHLALMVPGETWDLWVQSLT